MASSSFSSLFSTFIIILSFVIISHQQQPLDYSEQDSLFQVLHSINSDIPWPELFSDDLCLSAPHGVVCDFIVSDDHPSIVELSFGFISDESPNPSCSSNATLNPLLFTSFKHLRKLFFYKCFNHSLISLPDFPPSFASTLEELVFIENPSLVGNFSGLLSNFTNLRRLVLTGNGVSGEVPTNIGALLGNLEEMTLSRNQLVGEIPESLGSLTKLKILDLSQNNFHGCVPESLGNLTELLKLDLSLNRFIGQIPECFKSLRSLEFLDLSFNLFGDFGVPLFLGEIPTLKEIYLSGNLLGGRIPEIWENLKGVVRIGFSEMGLIGNIPASMGFYLRNLSYLGLDNNHLEGPMPEEFVFMEVVDEINLENNNLSGRVPFSRGIIIDGEKLKLGGNRGLCVDDRDKMRLLRNAKNKTSLGQLKICKKPDIPNAVLVNNGVSLVLFDPHVVFMFLVILFVFTRV